MSDYVVSARKWRPMLFEDVAGQAHIITTLRNALSSGRIAHAYLFSGPRGVGKTTTARLLAKAVNCSSPVDQNPDNTCESCLEITGGRSFDVLEIDGASNRGVEEIRNLRESVRYAPARGRYKVYIIDEVHMLTKEAFNALLKTLEEPPPHILFIFATTEINKVPATILSRCQRFDFRRIRTEEIAANLETIARAEGLTFEREALLLVARRGDGSLRDAQSLFDQVVALCGTEVTREKIVDALNLVDQEVYFRLTGIIAAGDTAAGLALVDEVMRGGHDIREFLAGLTEHLRNLLIARTTGATTLIEAADTARERYASAAPTFSVTDLLRLERLVAGTESALRWSSQPRFRLEADVVQMIALPRAKDVGELIRKLDDVMGGGTPAATPGVTPAAPQAAPAVRQAAPAVSEAARVAPQAPPPAGELSARWGEFLGEVRTKKISLWPALENAAMLGLERGVVRLGVADEFQASLVDKNREVLSEILQSVFHQRFGVRAEVTVVTPVAAPRPGGADTPKDSAPRAVEDHPLIATLRRELGAEPM
ncbi:MAG TPA: DNA polymerase III subunit gamma/tau [Bacteroidota bacterium]|nr:DNA polymerase III subunit gamma/tau [Bacteroidota bacterium]